jgi:hypothetical protein
MWKRLHVKYALLLSDFNETWVSQHILENLNTKFYQNPSVEIELFHADGQLDGPSEGHDEANSHFSEFWERA